MSHVMQKQGCHTKRMLRYQQPRQAFFSYDTDCKTVLSLQYFQSVSYQKKACLGWCYPAQHTGIKGNCAMRGQSMYAGQAGASKVSFWYDNKVHKACFSVRPFQVISLFLVNFTLENLPGNQEEKNKPSVKVDNEFEKKHNRKNKIFKPKFLGSALFVGSVGRFSGNKTFIPSCPIDIRLLLWS